MQATCLVRAAEDP